MRGTVTETDTQLITAVAIVVSRAINIQTKPNLEIVVTFKFQSNQNFTNKLAIRKIKRLYQLKQNQPFHRLHRQTAVPVNLSLIGCQFKSNFKCFYFLVCVFKLIASFLL